MKSENKPLSPEWLRRLRDANSKCGQENAQARREAALQLARRLGLKISESTTEIS